MAASSQVAVNPVVVKGIPMVSTDRPGSGTWRLRRHTAGNHGRVSETDGGCRVTEPRHRLRDVAGIARTIRTWTSRTAILAVVVMLAGCTSTPSQPESTLTPTPGISLGATSSAAPTDPGAAAVQAAVAAYRGMWDAYMGALATPDPDSPELARYATGNALKTLVDGVRDVRDQGLKGEGRFTVSPQVIEVAPASAPTKIGIRDCVNTAQSRIVRASPGPAYSDKLGGRRLCLATVERQSDGAWKVTSFGLHEVGTCS